MQRIMILMDRKNCQLRNAVQSVFEDECVDFLCVSVNGQLSENWFVQILNNIDGQYDRIVIFREYKDIQEDNIPYKDSCNMWLVPLCRNESEIKAVHIWSQKRNNIINIYKVADLNALMNTQKGDFYLYAARQISLLIREVNLLEECEESLWPKMSVITVCYNAEQTIEKAVRSVIDQKYPNKEIIIIDGASTDHTVEIVDKYKEYINVFVSERDEGIFDAMNKGVKYATGEIISFINSDDWMEPGAMTAVAATFISQKSDVVIGDSYYISKQGNMFYYNGDENGDNNIHVRMPYHHESVFAKKNKFLKEDNFNTAYKIAADYDWLLRNYVVGMTIARIHIPIFTFAYGGVSSVNVLECGAEARRIAIYYAKDSETLELIEKRWHDVVRSALNIDIIRKIKDVYLQEFRDMDYLNDTYIWGTGLWAKRNTEILLTIYENIKGFVDNNVLNCNMEFCGKTVYESGQVSRNSNIIIATPKYAHEIERQLLDCGWDGNRIIMADSIVERIINLVSREWSNK